MNMMSVSEKIAAGEYSQGSFPIRHELLNQIAGGMTVEELRQLPALKEKYDAELDLYRRNSECTPADFMKRLRHDIEEEYGVEGETADRMWKFVADMYPPTSTWVNAYKILECYDKLFAITKTVTV